MVQVGTTKDQGLYNKPSAAVHPGALAAGTLPQYNTHTFAVLQHIPTFYQLSTGNISHWLRVVFHFKFNLLLIPFVRIIRKGATEACGLTFMSFCSS